MVSLAICRIAYGVGGRHSLDDAIPYWYNVPPCGKLFKPYSRYVIR